MLSKRKAYLGADSVFCAENAQGHVHIASPQSRLAPGYRLKCADTVPDVEQFWKRMDAQEREAAEKMNEALFHQRERRLADMRANLNRRLLSLDCSNAERDFIKQCLAILDRKEDILQRNSVYGVAFMQEHEAPLLHVPRFDPLPESEMSIINKAVEVIDRKIDAEFPLAPAPPVVYKPRSEGISDTCVREGDTCAMPTSKKVEIE
jgi:hypothetical protein